MDPAAPVPEAFAGGSCQDLPLPGRSREGHVGARSGRHRPVAVAGTGERCVREEET